MPAQIITGTSWQVTELNGITIDPNSYQRQAPYITFNTANKISGSSGCNGFSGSYNLNDEGGMNISQIAATKMFCEGVDEKGFFDALNKVTMTKAETEKLTLMNGVDVVMVLVPKK